MLKNLFERFGVEVKRRSKFETNDRLAGFFSALKKGGLDPSLIFDIGAHKGDWTKKALGYFPDARYVLFEPQGELRQQSHPSVRNMKSIRWENSAVTDNVGTGEFIIAKRPDSSSLIWSLDDPIAAKKVSVPLTTLDQVVLDSGGEIPQIVKIDAEGADLKVLDGSRRLLGVTDIFFVEAAVCCPNVENTFCEVTSRMRDEGYDLIGITSLISSPATGMLWLVEAAFLRAGSGIVEYFNEF